MIKFDKAPYCVDTDASRIDRDVVFGLLTRTYWAAGIERKAVGISLDHSICFGLYKHDALIGFARVITDYAVFAYLADVVIEPSERGAGLGKWLISCIMAHPDLADIRKWMLVTKDAQGLYERFGFERVSRPGRVMEKRNFTLAEPEPKPIDGKGDVS